MTNTILLALLLAGTPAPPATTAGATAAPGDSSASDSLRARLVARTRRRRTTVVMGTVVPGYLSPRGLPPRAGEFTITDTGLVFRSSDGLLTEIYPLAAPRPATGTSDRRVPSVTLAYLDQDASPRLYVFRLDGAVFHTANPGRLLEAAERGEWVDGVTPLEWQPDRPLVPAGDTAASRAAARSIAAGTYADTLYALFGRPARPVGQVGLRGRKAGRLGEYLATRDSLALDPARMTSHEQLRHTLAHELGHRWQARAPGQLELLWQGIPAIRDPRRYGHDSRTEHQAEAIAFAVHFLQATAAAGDAHDPAALLEQYERMVPGTSLMARFLALQPVYAGHPLRGSLTRGPGG